VNGGGSGMIYGTIKGEELRAYEERVRYALRTRVWMIEIIIEKENHNHHLPVS